MDRHISESNSLLRVLPRTSRHIITWLSISLLRDIHRSSQLQSSSIQTPNPSIVHMPAYIYCTYVVTSNITSAYPLGLTCWFNVCERRTWLVLALICQFQSIHVLKASGQSQLRQEQPNNEHNHDCVEREFVKWEKSGNHFHSFCPGSNPSKDR